MREKFLFNFLTGQEIKPNLTVFPNTPTFLKAMNVKLIMSTSRNEKEPRCKIIKVTDVMFPHIATWPALSFFKIA